MNQNRVCVPVKWNNTNTNLNRRNKGLMIWLESTIAAVSSNLGHQILNQENKTSITKTKPRSSC